MSLIRHGLLAILAVAVVGSTTAKKIPWWNLKIAQQQGPNACVVETVPGTDRNYYTECKYWNNRDICGQKAVIRYECCEGFQQVPGQQGCTGVKPLKNILETARDLGARKFVKYMEGTGMSRELNRGGAYTLFAPTDEAFDDVLKEMKQRLNGLSRNPQNPILQYHLLDRKMRTHQFMADQLVDTRYPKNKLRINKYSSGVETVNCAAILRKDQEATNGIVHIIDKLLDPEFSVHRDLADIIVQDGRFSELAKAMEQSDFISRLRANKQSCTMFAPSDEAFQKIPQSRLERIMSDKKAREALLENHMLPHPVCLPAILGEHRVRTLGPEKLSLDCDKKGKMVDKKRLRSDFTLGQNGLIYMVDDLLLPDRAKSLMQLMEQEKLFAFLQVVRFAGMEDAFENFGDYTLFAPSEGAIYSLSSEMMKELKTNKELARKFVMFHATQGRITTDKMADNQVVMSLDEEHPLRLQVYRKSLGVEDALIEKADLEGMNGCIHIINKALTPSNSSAGDILRQNGNFSIFLQAMERVMEVSPESLDLKKAGSSFTFFVPSDQAFSRLGPTKLEKMMDDIPYLTKTIKNHVVENMISSESFKPDLYYDIRTTMNGVDVTKKNGKLKVNDATMTKCDIVNTNGLIHVINKVLLPDHNVRPNN